MEAQNCSACRVRGLCFSTSINGSAPFLNHGENPYMDIWAIIAKRGGVLNVKVGTLLPVQESVPMAQCPQEKVRVREQAT